MVDTTINRKPGDSDFDIEEICKEIKFQNNLGNQLGGWTISSDSITLSFK